MQITRNLENGNIIVRYNIFSDYTYEVYEDYVELVGEAAFASCYSLERVDFMMRRIEKQAFDNCISLENIKKFILIC